MEQQSALMATRSHQTDDDNMIPLINIVFLLLIFFMVAGQIKAMPDATLELPESALQQQPVANPLRLEMLADGSLLLNSQSVALENLAAALGSLDYETNTSLSLFVDRRVTAMQLTELLQPLRQLELGRVQLMTNSSEAGQS